MNKYLSAVLITTALAFCAFPAFADNQRAKEDADFAESQAREAEAKADKAEHEAREAKAVADKAEHEARATKAKESNDKQEGG